MGHWPWRRPRPAGTWLNRALIHKPRGLNEVPGPTSVARYILLHTRARHSHRHTATDHIHTSQTQAHKMARTSTRSRARAHTHTHSRHLERARASTRRKVHVEKHTQNTQTNMAPGAPSCRPRPASGLLAAAGARWRRSRTP
jgi:hypothetical protein